MVEPFVLLGDLDGAPTEGVGPGRH
jgi:hypothetical protein